MTGNRTAGGREPLVGAGPVMTYPNLPMTSSSYNINYCVKLYTTEHGPLEVLGVSCHKVSRHR